MRVRRPVALTIAGTDSGGGAGVVADVKTFEAHGVWGAIAVTAVTAQDTSAVHAVHALPASVVRAQIDAVLRDLGVDGAKTGMLASAEIVDAVAAAAVPRLVVDPVLAATTGAALLDGDALDVLRARLLPTATVVTPNLAEAGAIVGGDVRTRADMEAAARAIAGAGVAAVLVTGGHLDDERSSDCLALPGGEVRWLDALRHAATGTHGSGCVLSAAIAAELARGMDPADACVAGKAFVTRAIAAGVAPGAGAAAVDPGWERA